MSYLRVIPRDLFNEANLLKCLGQLTLAMDRLPEGVLSVEMIGDPSEAFQIMQDASDGSLWVANILIQVNGKNVICNRPLNSREPWPLYANFAGEVVSVFDNNGGLTKEFIKLGALADA